MGRLLDHGRRGDRNADEIGRLLSGCAGRRARNRRCLEQLARYRDIEGVSRRCGWPLFYRMTRLGVLGVRLAPCLARATGRRWARWACHVRRRSPLSRCSGLTAALQGTRRLRDFAQRSRPQRSEQIENEIVGSLTKPMTSRPACAGRSKAPRQLVDHRF
jgi:hypothetical protein